MTIKRVVDKPKTKTVKKFPNFLRQAFYGGGSRWQ